MLNKNIIIKTFKGNYEEIFMGDAIADLQAPELSS